MSESFNLNGVEVSEELLSVLTDVVEEVYRAVHDHGTFKSHRDAHSVILEEYEEFWDEVKADRVSASVREATQLAAMAIRYILEFGDHHPS